MQSNSRKSRPTTAKTKFAQKKLDKKRLRYAERAEKTARAEILCSEEAGFVEADDDDEHTYELRQKDITSVVDISSATKHFDLNLTKFGPYRVDYSRNGRHLLIGGRMGHVAGFDWLTKKLHFETNVLESVRDVQWLHIETMFAVAQKRWTYIYDNMGVELHCLKNLFNIRRLEYLPYHFLLVAGAQTSYLQWVDVSIGKLVQSFPTKFGAIDVMTKNAHNAIIHCGHSNGTVSLWSPNVKEPLVKMLAHPCAVRGISIDESGTYMATSGLDRTLRIWDIRQYKQLHSYKLPFGLNHVAFSQRKLLAASVGNTVQIFNNAHLGHTTEPYLVHRCSNTVSDIRFCPYEDVLGIGHYDGFTSIIVPGAGEPNIDALEANPYQSKNARREHEVKSLLDKIQPEMITLDPAEIAKVDTEALEANLDARAKVAFLKPIKIDYTPRHKMKGRGSAMKQHQRKQHVIGEKRHERNEKRKEIEKELFNDNDADKAKIDALQPKSVLDRFKRKD